MLLRRKILLEVTAVGLDQEIVSIIRRVTVDDVEAFSKAFHQNETRKYIYPDALKKVQGNFGLPDKMSEGISDLLRGWHNSFYRFGPFDEVEISRSVDRHLKELNSLRITNIRDIELDAKSEARIGAIFDSFLDATAGKNRKFTRRTVTGTSKALGLLAPSLFPMVDEAISVAYRCPWVFSEFGFDAYIKFMSYMKILAKQLVGDYSRRQGVEEPDEAEELLVAEMKVHSGDRYEYKKALLKAVDEYNYAKYTKRWC